MTLEEGCNKSLDNCRSRNLREGTINHYCQSYVQFAQFFDMQMQVRDMDEKLYQKYVVFLRETLHNDVSINAYLRDFITTMHFLMREGYVPQFRMQAIKVDRSGVETYSEPELTALLKKPNIKKCSFTEYQCWGITNFLFSTDVCQRSLSLYFLLLFLLFKAIISFEQILSNIVEQIYRFLLQNNRRIE